METEHICTLCNKCYSSTSTLRRHMQLKHNEARQEAKSKFILCPLCTEKTEEQKPYLANHDHLVKHLIIDHEVPITEVHLKFNNMAEFETWRNDENRLVDYACHKHHNGPYGDRYLYYNCIRSNVRGFLSKRKIRKPKRGGTIRISGICPARINAKIFLNGRVSVKYIDTHVGHDNVLDLRSKRLLKADKLRMKRLSKVEQAMYGEHLGYMDESTEIQDTQSISGVLYEGVVWDAPQSKGVLIGRVVWNENTPAEASNESIANSSAHISKETINSTERSFQAPTTNPGVSIIVPISKLTSVVSINVPGINSPTEVSNETINLDAKSSTEISNETFIPDAKSSTEVSTEKIIPDIKYSNERIIPDVKFSTEVSTEKIISDVKFSTEISNERIVQGSKSTAGISLKFQDAKFPAEVSKETFIPGAKSPAEVSISVPGTKSPTEVSNERIIPDLKHSTEVSNERIVHGSKSTARISLKFPDAKFPSEVSKETFIPESPAEMTLSVSGTKSPTEVSNETIILAAPQVSNNKIVENTRKVEINQTQHHDELNLLESKSQSSETVNDFNNRREIQLQEIRKYTESLNEKSFDEFMNRFWECKNNFERNHN